MCLVPLQSHQLMTSGCSGGYTPKSGMTTPLAPCIESFWNLWRYTSGWGVQIVFIRLSLAISFLFFHFSWEVFNLHKQQFKEKKLPLIAPHLHPEWKICAVSLHNFQKIIFLWILLPGIGPEVKTVLFLLNCFHIRVPHLPKVPLSFMKLHV